MHKPSAIKKRSSISESVKWTFTVLYIKNIIRNIVWTTCNCLTKTCREIATLQLYVFHCSIYYLVCNHGQSSFNKTNRQKIYVNEMLFHHHLNDYSYVKLYYIINCFDNFFIYKLPYNTIHALNRI